MSRKSKAADKLKRYLSYVKKLGWCVGMVRANRGSEYFGMDGEYVQKDSDKRTPEHLVTRSFWVTTFTFGLLSGYSPVTLRLLSGYSPVTWWLLGGYRAVTTWLRVGPNPVAA